MAIIDLNAEHQMKTPPPSSVGSNSPLERQIAAFDQTLHAGLYEMSKKNQMLHHIFVSNQVALTAAAFDIGQSQIENGGELAKVCQRAVDDLEKARQLIIELLSGVQASFTSKIAHLKSLAVQKEAHLCQLMAHKRLEDDQMAAFLSKQMVQKAIQGAIEEEKRASAFDLIQRMNEPLKSCDLKNRDEWAKNQKAQQNDPMTEMYAEEKRFFPMNRSLSETLDLLDEISFDSPRDFDKRATC